MQVNRSGDSILYRSGMNVKIKRNCFYSRKYSRKYSHGCSARAISSQRSRSTFQTRAFRWCVTTAGIPKRCAASAGRVQWRYRRSPRASPPQQQRKCVAHRDQLRPRHLKSEVLLIVHAITSSRAISSVDGEPEFCRSSVLRSRREMLA